MSLHSFDPDIAKRVGVNAAVLYQNVLFWTEKNMANGRHIHEGLAWTYNSVRAWGELFPYLSSKQVRTALEKLVSEGLLVEGNFNKMQIDRTKWYAAPDLPIKANDICPKGKMAFAQKGEPIPDSKPDINTDGKLSPHTPTEVEIAFSEYNEASILTGWPKAQALTKQRKAKIVARLKDAGGIEGWRTALEKAKASDFLSGRKTDFMVSLDFILQASSFTKLMEGNYDNRTGNNSGLRPSDDPTLRAIFDAATDVAARGVDRN